MMRKKSLDNKCADIGGVEGGTNLSSSKPPDVVTWKPGDKLVNEDADEKVGRWISAYL
jgi:hypothetical protein